jgi:CDP-4-dehydro-6-deoxyglucose reductase
MNPINCVQAVRKVYNAAVKNSLNEQAMPIKEYHYTVKQVAAISPHITQIILQPTFSAQLNYQAGQYIKIIYPDGNASPLSIANAPTKTGLLELHLSHPQNNVQAHVTLALLVKGKEVSLRGPYGTCTYTKILIKRPIIFLARGTGIAPIKAVIEELKNHKQYPVMNLYWSVTSPKEFYLHDLIKQWVQEIPNFSYTPILTRQHSAWKERVGLLQQVVLEDYPDIKNTLVYISAPESIVYEVWNAFQQVGLSKEYYYSDVFDYDPN